MCNLVHFLSFGEGRNDAWYREERLPLELSTPGVTQVRSWRTLKAEREDMNRTNPNLWDRMTEVRFAKLQDAEAALCTETSLWRAENRQGLDRFEGIIVGDQPQYYLLKDVPPQQYPYMSVPVVWKAGRPPNISPPETADYVRYMYFFNYREEVDVRLGEEWYLGHHTREGKQIPGMLTYETSLRRPLPRLKEFIPELVMFYRYTEIGQPTIESEQLALSPQSPESPRYMPSTHYPQGVLSNWRNFFIPPEADIVLVNK